MTDNWPTRFAEILDRYQRRQQIRRSIRVALATARKAGLEARQQAKTKNAKGGDDVSDLPLLREEREQVRERYRQEHLAAAEVAARRCRRSMKCIGDLDVDGRPSHAEDPDGCRNDGTNCICECHDREAAVS